MPGFESMIPQMAGNVGQGLTGIASIIYGLGQTKKAKALIRNNPFPNMQVPEAIKRNYGIAENMYNTGLPTAQYNQGLQNIGRSTNTALDAAGSRRGALGMIGRIQGQANDAYGNLDVADANARIANQSKLLSQGNILGEWQNKVWDWNKRQKYMQQAAAARALLGAGKANLWGGVDRAVGGIVGAGAGAAAGGFTNSMGGGGASGFHGTAGANGDPTYYNGNDENTDYSDFQTNY